MDEIAIVKKQIRETEWTGKIRKEICEQIPVPVMTVPEVSPVIKISIGDVTAEFPEGHKMRLLGTRKEKVCRNIAHGQGAYIHINGCKGCEPHQ